MSDTENNKVVSLAAWKKSSKQQTQTNDDFFLKNIRSNYSQTQRLSEERQKSNASVLRLYKIKQSKS